MSDPSIPTTSEEERSHLYGVLRKLVIPALEKEEDPACEGNSIEDPDPESDDACVCCELRGGWQIHIQAFPIDGVRTQLRMSLLCGNMISDCPWAVILLGNLLDHTPFVIQTSYELAILGEINLRCDLTVRAGDASFVHRRLVELRQMAIDLSRLLPLRIPHFLPWQSLQGLEIPITELPHHDLEDFLDVGLASPRRERTPRTLLRIAQGLERWKDVLRLLRDHPGEWPDEEKAALKCLALYSMERWLPAIRAAEAGGIRKGVFPGGEIFDAPYVHAKILAGDAIDALRVLGKHRNGEPTHADWLRGMAFHQVGDQKHSEAAFDRYFYRWPTDFLGLAAVSMLDGEEE